MDTYGVAALLVEMRIATGQWHPWQLAYFMLDKNCAHSSSKRNHLINGIFASVPYLIGEVD